MKAACAAFAINEKGRDFIVGDVHGCFRRPGEPREFTDLPACAPLTALSPHGMRP